MRNGWLPISMARHLGAATAESGKAKRFLFWIRGHGHDFGHVYLSTHRRGKQRPKLIAVPENCRGCRVIAIKPLGPGPNTKRRFNAGEFKAWRASL